MIRARFRDGATLPLHLAERPTLHSEVCVRATTQSDVCTKDDSFHLTRDPGSDCTQGLTLTDAVAYSLSSRRTAFNINAIPPQCRGA